MVPMLESLNRGSGDSFFNLENKFRNLLNSDPEARIDLHIYPQCSEGRVPAVFEVENVIDGVKQVRKVFDNE